MRYCGIAVAPGFQQLCAFEEILVEEPPVRLRATFYEPGKPGQVIAQVRALGDVVVAVAAPARAGGERACDRELARRGVPPQHFLEPGRELFEGLADLGIYTPQEGSGEGPVEEGAFRHAAVFETSADGVFAALQGRRVPARRHPLGIQRRIQELADDHVIDEGGDLWQRRIEEIEAAGAALAAHRYAVAHASWLGDPDEGVVVLPGSRVPERFSAEGVVPELPRVPLARRAGRPER
jgi:hypothetical protein